MFKRFFFWLSLLVLSLLAGLGLVIAGEVEANPLRARLLLWTAGFAAGGLIVTLLLSWWLTRWVLRPLRDLVEAVGRVGEVGIGPRLVSAADAEFVQLAESFNRISEQLTARIARLEEDRQQLRTVLSGMVEGVIALDADTRILYVNERAEHLLELSPPTPVGRPLWEVVRHRPLLDAVKIAQQRLQPHREEFAWHGASTRSLTVHAVCLPGQPPKGTVLVLHDTTELRRLERLRQDFVANVSHELKTPLSVIKVCVETLQDGAAEDPLHRGKFLEQMARQTDRLHSLILDLLSLARIESGSEQYDFGPVDMCQLIQHAVDRHRPRAESRRQLLHFDVPEPVLHAWADEEALEQILENLLDNAVKYTPEGGRILVRCFRQADQVVLEVQDTGIGIPEADLPRIFERFYRVDKARSREMGGTGLGLSIVKHLVGAMQGTVSASSQIGVGTTFTVRLPLASGN
jgi:two-component system phosphate regulon sensor histidine kinase PhoR